MATAPNFKRTPWRSRKYLDAAMGQPCIRCGSHSETVVAAHYSGMWSNKLGKGSGQKADDCAVADLCHECHTHFDQYADGNDAQRAVEFLMSIVLTVKRRLEQGVLKS